MDVPPALHVWCMPKVMATPTFSIHCTRMRGYGICERERVYYEFAASTSHVHMVTVYEVLRNIMASIMKPKTAVIIALTVTAVAVSSLVLLPRSSRVSKDPEPSPRLLTSRTGPHPAESSKQSKVLKPLATFLSNVEDENPDLQSVQAAGKPNSKTVPPNRVMEKAPRIVAYKGPVLTTRLTAKTSPVRFRFTNTSSDTLLTNKLPSMTRGSVEIRPERMPPPAHSSDIYISLLTTTKFHDTRISLQYLTWLQTIDPKQVSLHDHIYVPKVQCFCKLSRKQIMI